MPGASDLHLFLTNLACDSAPPLFYKQGTEAENKAVIAPK